MRGRIIRPVLIAAASATLAIAAAFLWRTSPAAEPSYNGRRLTWWLSLAANDNPDGDRAIRALGTNSLPFLVWGLGCRDSAVRDTAYRLADRVGLRLSVSSALQRQILAYVGFRALGPVGVPAIPDLLSLANDTNTSNLASQSLAAVGREGVEALCTVVTNSDWQIRRDAVAGLGTAPLGKSLALDAVLRATKDPNFVVRWAATRAIGDLGAEPARSVPALASAVNDGTRAVRAGALEALGSFGSSARQAVEIVHRATNDPDPVVRSAAFAALRRIE